MEICNIFDERLKRVKYERQARHNYDNNIITYYINFNRIILDVLIDDQEIAFTAPDHNIVWEYHEDDYVEVAEQIIVMIEKILDPKK